MENLKRSEKIESPKNNPNKPKFNLNNPKLKKHLIQSAVISLTAGAFFTIGFFQPRAEKNPTHFVSNTQKHSEELKKLTDTQTQLQNAQKQLSDAQAKTKQAQADEKTANETKIALDADIKEKQGTQDTLNSSINDLKAQKESLETQIATEKTVQTATSNTTSDGSTSSRVQNYNNMVNDFKKDYHELGDVTAIAAENGPSFMCMKAQYDKWKENKDEATSIFILDNPAHMNQKEQVAQFACLMYDVIREYEEGNWNN